MSKQPYPEKCYLPLMFYPTAMWSNTYGDKFVEDHMDLESDCGDYVIYISIPFCRVRCKGCPYFVDLLTKKDPNDKETRYVNALIKDIEKWGKCNRFANSKLRAIYIGGGTGSILKTENLKRLMNSLCDFFPVDNNTEITLEGNAHDYDEEKINYVANSPINRISLGVQSFNKEVLKVVGSPHAAEESEKVIRSFQEKGLKNIQIDMMYNMPKHTLKIWRQDLKKLKELKIVHLTVYLYRIHEGTPQDKFIKEGKVPNVKDRESFMVKKMFSEFKNLVEKEMGFKMYMYNHFCKPGYTNVYNDYGMQNATDTLGIGAGAYSLIDNYRIGTSKDIQNYIDKVNKGFHVVTTISKKMNRRNHKERYIMFTLQYLRIYFDKYKKKFNSGLMEDFGNIIKKLERKKLLSIKKEFVEMTDLGREWFLNVILEFVNPEFWGDEKSKEEPNWSMNIGLVDILAGNKERWLGVSNSKDYKNLSQL